MAAVERSRSVRSSGRDHMFAIRLMEHLVVPVFVLDPRGRVLIWNRACEALTGIPASEVVGTKDHWRGFYEAPRPCLADIVLQSERGDLSGLYAEHVHSPKGHVGVSAENWCAMPQAGSTRYLAIDAGPIYDDLGQLVAVVETLRDITVQKEAQLALQALASSDGLTGLANRRTLDSRLQEEFRRARRTRSPISLLMIDIDHFKLFNDALGHQAGDECLKHFARLLADQMQRPGDLAARYGGEEFAVLLPDTPSSGAAAVASRIATAVAAAQIPHTNSPTAAIITLSIGVACCTATNAGEGKSLVEAADAALYRAKSEGRDRIAMARPMTNRSKPNSDHALREAPHLAS